MTDQEHKAKDKPGPDEAGRYGGISEPTDADAEGHAAKWGGSPEPAVTVDDASEPTSDQDDTEGQGMKWNTPGPSVTPDAPSR